jgi:hypothetical protein
MNEVVIKIDFFTCIKRPPEFIVLAPVPSSAISSSA